MHLQLLCSFTSFSQSHNLIYNHLKYTKYIKQVFRDINRFDLINSLLKSVISERKKLFSYH